MKFSKSIVLIISILGTSFFSQEKTVAEEVYFIRGGFDVFSTGMNEMAKTLQAKGINASAHSIVAWKSIANDIIKRSKEKKVSYPIIFLGHSLGADAAPDFANYLGENGISVDLVIGFDATGTRTFRNGAKKVINYKNPIAGDYVKGAGFKGTITQIDVSKYKANHFNIEKVDAIQKLALAAVLSKLGRR